MSPQRYALALELACQTISTCLDAAPLPEAERRRLHGVLGELQVAWGDHARLQAPLNTLRSALSQLPAEHALAARVSLQTISQWGGEVLEAAPPRRPVALG
ncbi:hypothetical protein [Deinococcus multiflagellatus]|uniref:Uncharacterized protein n=1 Tax=Deinococcus multiflagellatus TaxID=1656887 RepID=A0ABW1ZPI7_9DEIO|nr:hypothetical protein [Deinococcus multiflagellatus]MBZ9715155.1 hypothetical protein [Deinococcus multiflagellatus]